MRHPEPDPAIWGGMGDGRFLPRPSRSSSSRRPALSFSEIGRERKSYSSSEDSAKKREASAFIVRFWRYIGFINSERKEVSSVVSVNEVAGEGGASVSG